MNEMINNMTVHILGYPNNGEHLQLINQTKFSITKGSTIQGSNLDGCAMTDISKRQKMHMFAHYRLI